MYAPTYRIGQRTVRTCLALLGLVLGVSLALGQVDWGVIEDGEIPQEEPLVPPAAPEVPAPEPLEAPQAVAPAPARVAPQPEPSRVQRRRRPSGYVYRPKRQELEREFPLENVDVATLLSVRVTGRAGEIVAADPGLGASAELPLVIDEPRPVEVPPAQVAKAPPIPIEAAVPVEDPSPPITEDVSAVAPAASLEVTSAQRVVIEEAAPPEPAAYEMESGDQPLLIEEPRPEPEVASESDEERPLVIEALAPVDGAASQFVQPQEPGIPAEDEQPLVIEGAPPVEE